MSILPPTWLKKILAANHQIIIFFFDSVTLYLFLAEKLKYLINIFTEI